jgi:heme/copper-type cytochrome/quinol oxidase subunit 2
VDWVFNFGIAVVIAMVLVNLTVSIFTDVYGTIKENNEAFDVEVLNEVTMDVEVFSYWFLFWRRTYKKYETNFDDLTEERKAWFKR